MWIFLTLDTKTYMTCEMVIYLTRTASWVIWLHQRFKIIEYTLYWYIKHRYGFSQTDIHWSIYIVHTQSNLQFRKMYQLSTFTETNMLNKRIWFRQRIFYLIDQYNYDNSLRSPIQPIKVRNSAITLKLSHYFLQYLMDLGRE